MPLLLSMFLLVLAVSLDGFGVGITYGIRKIKIPVLSIVIISICSGTVMLLSMSLGLWMSNIISPSLADGIGGIILIGIGLNSIYQVVFKRTDPNETPKQQKKRWNMVFGILKTPSIADIDRSGVISAHEAAFLGVALSLDAFGAGIGASMLGFSPLITAALTAICCGSFLAGGLYAGRVVQGLGRISMLPGMLLIFMGIWKGFF